jgi:nucleoside-diphosphate-sugar epimerase
MNSLPVVALPTEPVEVTGSAYGNIPREVGGVSAASGVFNTLGALVAGERLSDVLAPGDPSDPVQIIDARDLAEWIIRLAERRVAGDFNAVGPEQPMPIGRMLTGIRDALGADARFTWVDPAFLEESLLVTEVNRRDVHNGDDARCDLLESPVLTVLVGSPAA